MQDKKLRPPVLATKTAAEIDDQLFQFGSSLQLLSFRFIFLGKQGLSRQTSTGFGSLQRALRELYFNYLSAGGDSAIDRSSERTINFQESGVGFRYWDSSARQFQQDFYPYEYVTYSDLVHFSTVKGRKKRFGYFRRHSDPKDVIPESVLIPLHRREYRMLRQMTHRPILCLVTRRPYGVQFLECNLFLTDSEDTGLSFIQEFDLRSRAKREAEQQQQHYHQHLYRQQQHPHPQLQSRYSPWYDRGNSSGAGQRFWGGSQPMLFHQQTMSSDLSEPDLTPRSTASSNRVAGVGQQSQPKEALVRRYRELQSMNLTSEYDDDDLLGGGDAHTAADGRQSQLQQQQPPPLPPRRRLPPAGGVRVLPWGPAVQRPVAMSVASSNYGNGSQLLKDRFVARRVVSGGSGGGDGGGGGGGGIKNRTAEQPHHPLEGANLDAESRAIDFGTALGYLP